MPRPLLPKGNDPQASGAYRKALHEDLYPNSQEWSPVKGALTSGSIDASYVRMGRMWSFGMTIEGPVTAAPGAFIDLPCTVSQPAVFSIAYNGTVASGVVEKGGNRIQIPSFGPVGRVVISGVVNA